LTSVRLHHNCIHIAEKITFETVRVNRHGVSTMAVDPDRRGRCRPKAGGSEFKSNLAPWIQGEIRSSRHQDRAVGADLHGGAARAGKGTRCVLYLAVRSIVRIEIRQQRIDVLERRPLALAGLLHCLHGLLIRAQNLNAGPYTPRTIPGYT
jgi:hypothetical protein